MEKRMTFALILALGTPAAAEFAAPELPRVDAAMVREVPFEIEISSRTPAPVTRTAEDIYFRSSLHSTREKAAAALQRILKDAKRQDIIIKNHPTVESQGEYYTFRINFGPGMYIDKVESYSMTHSKEAMIISGVELGGGIHLETRYEAERGMSVYYVMPEGKEPQEIDAD